MIVHCVCVESSLFVYLCQYYNDYFLINYKTNSLFYKKKLVISDMFMFVL